MTMTQEERTSRLEGAFEMFAAAMSTMVTKDELRASIEGLRAENRAMYEGLRAENRAAIEGLRAENQAIYEGLRAENRAAIEGLRAEMQAEIRAAELRIIRWNVGAIIGAATVIIAALKLLP